MKILISQIGFLLLFNVSYAQVGKSLYESKCKTCHNRVEANEPLTGPTLGGITNEVSLQWFSSYTKNPISMLAQGDFRALCLWEHWKPCIMPKYYDSLTNNQIEDIYEYIEDVTKKMNLHYELKCDSNETLSGYYMDSLENSICEQFGLKYSDCNFGESNIDQVPDVTATITGDYKKVEFYLIHETSKKFIPIYFDERNHHDSKFNLGPLVLMSGLNYLVVIGQRNFDEFNIQSFMLTGKDPKSINLTMNPRNKISEVVSNAKLH